MNKIGDEQIASTSFSIALNKILAINIKIKSIQKISMMKLKRTKQYGGKDQFESMLKQGMSLDDYKEQKNLPHIKTIISDKVKVSDKELKENTKKLLIF